MILFYLTNEHYAPLKRHKKLPLKKCVSGFIDQSDDAKIFIFLKDWITASQMLVELSWRPNFDLITTCQSGESIRRSTLRKQTSFSSFLEPYAVRPQLNRPDIISRVHILKMKRRSNTESNNERQERKQARLVLEATRNMRMAEALREQANKLSPTMGSYPTVTANDNSCTKAFRSPRLCQADQAERRKRPSFVPQLCHLRLDRKSVVSDIP